MTPQPQPHGVKQEPQTSPVHSMTSPQVTNKRKMDDRDSSEPMSYPSTANGSAQSSAAMTASPQQPTKKRIRYTEPPIWARSFRGFRKTEASIPVSHPVNGVQAVKGEPTPYSSTNGHPQANVSTPSVKGATTSSEPQPAFNGPLGMWEQSILGTDPIQDIARQVADWLYVTVVGRPDSGELQSRGVEIEIEAKLGTLTDMDTNQRIYYPVTSECLLDPQRSRVAFRSSMSEVSCDILAYLMYSNLQIDTTSENERVSECESRRDTSRQCQCC